MEVVGMGGRHYPCTCDVCGAREVRLTSDPLPMEYRGRHVRR